MCKNVILEKISAFSLRIINLLKHLCATEKEFVPSKQLLLRGTSFGANSEKAMGGYSKKKFTTILGVPHIEDRVIHYWLRLLHTTGYLNQYEFQLAISDCDEPLKHLFPFSEIQTHKLNIKC